MAILIASDNESDISFAQSLAEACKVELNVEKRLTSAVKEFQAAEHAYAYLVSADNPFQIRQNQAALSNLDQNKLHFICPKDNSSACENAFKTLLAGNVIFRQEGNIENSAEHYAQILQGKSGTCRAGLQHVMSGARVRSIEITDAKQKNFASDTVLFHLKEQAFSERIALSIASAVDELLLNAVFGVNTGKNLLDPNNIADEKKKGVTLQLASLGDYSAVNVIDKYGLLVFSQTFERIAQSFAGTRPEQMSQSDSGLGLSLIVNSGASLRFACSPGNFTEVGVFFKKTQKSADFKNQFQFITTQFWNE